MADRNTTGAVHLTSIDLDISGVRKNLEEIKNGIDETAKYVRDTKFTLGGSDSADTGFGKSIEKEFEQAKQSVQEFGQTIVSLSDKSRSIESLADSLQLKGTAEEIENAKNKLTSLFNEIGNFNKIDIQAKDGGLFKATVTSTDEAGRSIQKVIDLTKEFDNTYSSTRVTEKGNQNAEAIKREAISVEELTQKYKALEISTSSLSSVISGTNIKNSAVEELKNQSAELAQQVQNTSKAVQEGNISVEEMDRTYSKLSGTFQNISKLWSQVTREANESAKGISTSVKSFESLNLQYKNFQNTLAKSKLDDSIGKPLANIKSRADEAAKEISELTQTVKENGAATKPQIDLYNELQSTLKTLRGELKDTETAAIEMGKGFKEASDNAQTFGQRIEQALLKLGDRAKLMMSYQAIDLIQIALGNVVSTIQTTEDAVVDLQRVLTEDISDTGISKELYSIASEFGQTFENVKEVAIKFAQTGMGWQEVVDATRATMLGLNTAELEVTTATEGLIATINQFNIPASELETVIDKINITADHFPVTSEKIVAALQRAGGTASAFNMTLEETIATITTLAAQTGRSGETIGTVLNSLIIYTSKSKSLELFSGLSEDMDNVVKKFKAGSASIIDVWKQLGVEIDNLSEQQQSALFNSEAFEEFADTFEAEASDYAEAIRKIYGTAGTYRQNYLKVLLEDTENIEKVLENLSNAEGYSLEENKKYMDTLTARWNELVIAAQELAVQFGQSGFMWFLKFLTSATTGSLKLLKEIGGLNTVLGVLTISFIKVKSTAVNKWFEKTMTALFSFVTKIGDSVSSLKNFSEIIKSIPSRLKNLEISFSAVATGITAAITVINIAITKYREYKQAQEDARQANISEGIEAKEEAENIYKLYQNYLIAQKAYSETSESSSKLLSASNELISALKQEGIDVSSLTGNYSELSDQMKELMKLKLEDSLREQAEAVKDAKESMDEAFQQKPLFGGPINGSIFGVKENANGGYTAYSTKYSEEEILRVYDELKNARKDLIDTYGTEQAVYRDDYEGISKLIAQYKPYIEKLQEANKNLEETKQIYDNVINGTVELTETLDENGNVVFDYEAYLESAEKELEALADAFDKVSGKVDSFQSAYSSMIGIIDEYNKTGIMTADMLQTLLEMEPEYIAMLDVKAGSLGLNQSAVDGLVNANDVYLQQMIALKAAEEADALATQMAAAAKDGLTFAEYQAAYAGQTLQASLQAAIIAEINGTGTSYDLANAIKSVGEQAGLSGQYLDYFTNTINNYVSTLSSLYGKVSRGSLGTYYTPSVSTPKKSSGSGANNAAKEALQNEIKAWRKQKEAVNDYYKDLEDNLKKQKKESDEYYDGLIKNLKKVQEENDRINDQLDYYADRQKILRNLEQAQSRSGVEWREKEIGYQQDLVDLDEGWRRKLEDWSIEDQIKEIEELKKLADDLVDQQIEELKKLKDAAIKEIEDAIEKLQEKVNALSKSTGSSVASGISSGVSAGLSSAGSAIDDYTKGLEDKVKKTNSVIRKENELTTQNILGSYQQQWNRAVENIKQGGAIFNRQQELIAQNANASWANNFTGPVIAGLSTVANTMQNQMISSAYVSAVNALKQYQNNLINPLSNQLSNVLRGAMAGATLALPSTLRSTGSTSSGSTTNNTNFNMYANIGSTSAAQNTVKGISGLMGFNTNPNRR